MKRRGLVLATLESGVVNLSSLIARLIGSLALSHSGMTLAPIRSGAGKLAK